MAPSASEDDIFFLSLAMFLIRLSYVPGSYITTLMSVRICSFGKMVWNSLDSFILVLKNLKPFPCTYSYLLLHSILNHFRILLAEHTFRACKGNFIWSEFLRNSPFIRQSLRMKIMILLQKYTLCKCQHVCKWIVVESWSSFCLFYVFKVA